MSADPYFPFTPDKWRPDLFEPLGWAEREGGPVEGVPGESAAGGGDTRATRERDTQCCRDRADLMTGTTHLQVMIPDDDSFQSACLRGCWSVRGSAVCRCWAACVRREASCRAWTSGGGCARGVRQRGGPARSSRLPAWRRTACEQRTGPAAHFRTSTSY